MRVAEARKKYPPPPKNPPINPDGMRRVLSKIQHPETSGLISFVYHCLDLSNSFVICRWPGISYSVPDVFFLKSTTATENLFNIIIFNHEGIHNTLGFHFLSETSQTLPLNSFLKSLERISHFHMPQLFITGENIYIFCFYYLRTYHSSCHILNLW